MKTGFTRWFAGLTALAVALVFSAVGATPAQAAKAKSIKTEAKFVSYDADAKTITVKVMKTGKKPSDRALALKKGKDATFKIKPEGSVLSRTSVTLNGKRADIMDVPKGKTIIIYWVPHETLKETRFARKIDMILSDAELEARDKARLKEEQAKGRAAE
jgi:hypothetical protein